MTAAASTGAPRTGAPGSATCATAWSPWAASWPSALRMPEPWSRGASRCGTDGAGEAATPVDPRVDRLVGPLTAEDHLGTRYRTGDERHGARSRLPVPGHPRDDAGLLRIRRLVLALDQGVRGRLPPARHLGLGEVRLVRLRDRGASARRPLLPHRQRPGDGPARRGAGSGRPGADGRL